MKLVAHFKAVSGIFRQWLDLFHKSRMPFWDFREVQKLGYWCQPRNAMPRARSWRRTTFRTAAGGLLISIVVEIILKMRMFSLVLKAWTRCSFNNGDENGWKAACVLMLYNVLWLGIWMQRVRPSMSCAAQPQRNR